MQLQPRLLIAVSMTGLFCLAPVMVFGQAAPEKKYKDDAEFQLYDSILKDTNAKTKLDKLNQWQSKYPSTDFSKERRQLFLTTYVALNMPKQVVDSAKQVLADDPKDFNALYYTMLLTQTLAPSDPSVLETGGTASKALLANLDTPPAGATADQWAKLRPAIEALGHQTLGFIAVQKQNWDGAEQELNSALKVDPNNGTTDYLMYITQARKKNNSVAIFYYARAGAYDGPGALTPQGRQGALAEAQKLYTLYHGKPDGFNELVAMAKTTPMPPDGYHIPSKGELAKAAYEKESADQAKFAQEHPEWALWKNIKDALTGADGANYFGSNMKDTKVLPLKGKVVKLEPAQRPKTILIEVEDGTTSDTPTANATLKFETPLAGKVDEGTELTFEGVAESYTGSPLMVIFNVDKNDLHGWTGKNAPAAPAHKAAPKKKG